ncbi:MAG: DUF2252 family protein [Pseudomonadota bacterium]|nr:DUF2252 family protein [Pseudomonadota bacterium]
MWLILLASCAEPGPLAARAAWLQEGLTADNAYWLTRSPGLVETKYASMAADPYDWMRGSNALFLSDQVRPDPDRPLTRFLSREDAASVLLIGDPHLENLGTCLPGEEPDPNDATRLYGDGTAPLPLEWVDLDAAAFGPWTFDTRRSALALALVADAAEECEACVVPVVAAFAAAYADEITAQSRGERGWAADAEGLGEGALVVALRALALGEGLSSAAHDTFTVVEADDRGIGHRRIARDEGRDAQGDGVLELGLRDAAQLDRVLAGWTGGRPADFRRIDAARYYGKGIASLPATRFLVLWDRGEDGLDDDRLLNVREVLDPPSLDGLYPGLGSVFADNRDRIVTVSALFASRPDADVRVGAVADGAAAFKTTSFSGWFQTFDHEDIDRAFTLQAATPADLEALAATVGRALASAHARGTTLDGAPALPVIAEDLAAGGGADAFTDERLRDATADLATLHADHALFLALLDGSGPLLGAEVLYP